MNPASAKPRNEKKKGAEVVETAESAEAVVLSLSDIAEEDERALLASLCVTYREESSRETAAKNSKTALMKEISPLAEKLGIERGRMKLVAPPEPGMPSWELVQRTSSKTEVDPKRLLARGVSMEDIMYATIKKETAYYTVVEVKV